MEESGKELAIQTSNEILRRIEGSASSLPQVAVPGFLFGGAYTAILFQQPLIAGALIIFSAVLAYVVMGKEAFSNGLQVNKLPEEVSTPETRRMLRSVGIKATGRIVGPVVVPWLASLPLVAALPPSAGVIAALAITGAGTTMALRAALTNPYADGRRRARQLVQADPLRDVTAAGQKVLDSAANRLAAQVLLAAGAVGGTQARLWLVRRGMNVDTPQVVDAMRELEAAGLARINSIEGAEDPEKWYFELTDKGVRSLAARTR